MIYLINSLCIPFRTPTFTDEIKCQIPIDVDDGYHLLFTFCHISCKTNKQNEQIETPVGYTVSLFLFERLCIWFSGFHCLPMEIWIREIWTCQSLWSPFLQASDTCPLFSTCLTLNGLTVTNLYLMSLYSQYLQYTLRILISRNSSKHSILWKKSIQKFLKLKFIQSFGIWPRHLPKQFLLTYTLSLTS